MSQWDAQLMKTTPLFRNNPERWFCVCGLKGDGTAGRRMRSLNHHRTSWRFQTCRDVQRVQSLVVRSCSTRNHFGPWQNKYHIRLRIDDRSGSDSHLGRNVTASSNVGSTERLCPVGEETYLPLGRGRGAVGVEGIDAVVFGCHICDIA